MTETKTKDSRITGDEPGPSAHADNITPEAQMARIKEMDGECIMGTYRREDLCFVSGKGAVLEDIRGEKYLDMIAGIGVCGLGHCHPAVVRAIREQAGNLIHTSNLYYIQKQSELASALKILLPKGLDKLFFCNSGAEAVEGALKLAMLATGRDGIVAAVNSFHGRTAGALAATGQEKYRRGLGDYLPQTVSFVEYGNINSLADWLGPDTAAVILEPIQGEGGVVVPPEGYLQAVRRMCTENGSLLIFDEIQTGFCRTGKMFACEHENVSPDIMTMAKALGGGMPIGAIAAGKDIASAFAPGTHGTTFGGNPLACAAALAAVETMVAGDFSELAKRKGAYLQSMLEKLARSHPSVIKQVRGRGLMLGIVMEGEYAKAFKTYAVSKNILVNVAAEKVVRLLPPLVIRAGELRYFAAVLEEFLETVG